MSGVLFYVCWSVAGTGPSRALTVDKTRRSRASEPEGGLRLQRAFRKRTNLHEESCRTAIQLLRSLRSCWCAQPPGIHAYETMPGSAPRPTQAQSDGDLISCHHTYPAQWSADGGFGLAFSGLEGLGALQFHGVFCVGMEPSYLL